MKWDILTPSYEDANRIAEIHVAAMDSNILLHAQFPTPEALDKLEELLACMTVSQLKDRQVNKVLVARHPDSSEIISFIKWEMPRASGTEGKETEAEAEEFTWSEGSCQQYLDEYALLAEAAKQKAIGELACYRK